MSVNPPRCAFFCFPFPFTSLFTFVFLYYFSHFSFLLVNFEPDILTMCPNHRVEFCFIFRFKDSTLNLFLHFSLCQVDLNQPFFLQLVLSFLLLAVDCFVFCSESRSFPYSQTYCLWAQHFMILPKFLFFHYLSSVRIFNYSFQTGQFDLEN